MFEELKNELKSATTKHLEALKAQYRSSDLYGYSLYTDDDFCSIGPVANTVDAIPVTQQDPDYGYYKYGPHEWAIFEHHGLFDSVNKIVKDIHDNAGLPFESRRAAMLQVAMQVLVELEGSGIFGARTPSRYVVLWLSDSSDPIMSTSAEALNSPEVFSAYLQAYKD